jgi:hypothetical protein
MSMSHLSRHRHFTSDGVPSADEVAAALTRGPRGLRTLLEFAMRSEDAAHPGDVGPLRSLVFDAAHHRDDSSHAMKITEDGRVVPDLDVPDPGMDEVAGALDSVSLLAPSENLLRRCLSDAVTAARYWQAPAGEDVVALTPPVRAALGRVAAHLADAPLVLSWWTDADVDDQVRVLWIDPEDPESFVPPAPRPSLEALRAEASSRGCRSNWQSSPDSFRAITAGRFPDGTPMPLWLVEDEQGWTEAYADVVGSAAGRDVLEIRSDQDWITLCRAHPRDVTRARRQEWGEATGREGAWVQPNWSSISEEHEAIHLSLGAYLDLAGRAIDVGDGSATMIAGWHPDATYWFCDPPAPTGDAEAWRFVDRDTGTGADDLAWLRVERAEGLRTAGT